MVDQPMETQRMIRRTPVGILLALAMVLSAATGRGETATWGQGADVDSWIYPNYPGGWGFREVGPTFAELGIDPETLQFVPGSASYPSRIGMSVMAFDTSDQIVPDKAPTRYSVTSVTFTSYAVRSGPSNQAIYYTDQPLTPSELLSEGIGGGYSSQKPFELFGVGFREGYQGFALGTGDSGSRFSESSDPHGGAGDSYVAYPIVGDGVGGYIDVSNSYTGGFSATAPGGSVSPFTATPWAIGSADYAIGAELIGNVEYTFELDLSAPGVMPYVQQSLSEGAVGFMLSSMHVTGEFGQTGGAYPSWRMREADSRLASLTIEYTLLPTLGDYDGDGDADSDDYVVWSQSYGQTVTPGTGADGNGDGLVDASDYTVWRDASSVASHALSIPEPGAGLLILGGATSFLLLRNRERIAVPLNKNV